MFRLIAPLEYKQFLEWVFQPFFSEQVLSLHLNEMENDLKLNDLIDH